MPKYLVTVLSEGLTFYIFVMFYNCVCIIFITRRKDEKNNNKMFLNLLCLYVCLPTQTQRQSRCAVFVNYSAWYIMALNKHLLE